MKNIIAITALVLAGAATTASAATVANSVAERTIQQYAPNADLSQLSERQILVILNAINSDESRSEVTSTVRSLVNNAG
ncbi:MULTISPECIES: hypothetical protein [Marinovum]|jgi:hypothetical protein|uniref:Uncharacterized protein n=1 Tax=Marinovum algicola TaxID=42444 RepID=A0A975WFB4_9RHOB|nr:MULTISPECIES: hypothetical protein [Marinovum]AKO98127.1 hypothetical protein MALG_02978 [Marinovum algicola DG 898]MDD9739635.1 hypothetical protein [Marinovum sp. SP66]MDD9746550.1 hypothetical protein [Marinovum sp. PR37]SEK10798.1 hypothetical protein SAMN04487940_13418 [Marinovum algicola]SLN77344.1 hypothetical protein MAA5396_04981 [Marinovum algicola]